VQPSAADGTRSPSGALDGLVLRQPTVEDHLVEVGDDERVAALTAQPNVEQDGSAALPAQRVVTEQLPGRLERGRDDHRRLRQAVNPSAQLDLHVELPGVRLHPAEHGPQPPST
jgi:hypothetical protein